MGVYKFKNMKVGITFSTFNLFHAGHLKMLESLGNFIKAIETSFGVEAKKEFLLMQPGDVTKTWADISNFEKLGYQSSTKITDGFSKFVAWYKKYNKSI